MKTQYFPEGQGPEPPLVATDSHTWRGIASFRKSVRSPDSRILGEVSINFNYVLIINILMTSVIDFATRHSSKEACLTLMLVSQTPALIVKWQEILRQFRRKLKPHQGKQSLFSVICRAVFVNWSLHGPSQPTDIFGSQVLFIFYFLKIFSELPTFEIGEISNKTLDLRFLLENQRSSRAFIPTGG